MKDNSEKPTDSQIATLTRRSLVRRLGVTGGGLWALGSSGLMQPSTALAALVSSSIAAGPVALEVDGALTDLRAVEGGNAIADVLAEAGPPELPIAKRLGATNYEDIVLKVPLGVAPTFAAWISESLAKGPTTRSGAIVYSDFNRIERKRLAFSNAIISEIALPTCEASVKAPPQMTVRLTPEATRLQGGSGKSTQGAIGTATKIASNFRLNIQGLESAAPFVSKIEGMGVKRMTQTGVVGQMKFKQLQSAALDVQPIRIYLPENQAAPFYSWFESFVIKGGGATGEGERQGLLEWLAGDLTTVLASVQLQNLGIFHYAPEPYTSNIENTARVLVELYCERLSVSL